MVQVLVDTKLTFKNIRQPFINWIHCNIIFPHTIFYCIEWMHTKSNL